MSQPLRLHMGCGRQHQAGWVNCDLYPAPEVDAAFDCEKDWPFPDASAGAIYASHLLEHLHDPMAFFREAWRVLIPNGQIMLRLPHGSHRSAWWDHTHVRAWFPENFCCLQPGYFQANGNPQHADWHWPFAVAAADQRISAKFAPWLRRWWTRRPLLRYGEHLVGFAEELWVMLYALKTPEAVARYQADRENPTVVCSRWIMYRHHWEGRELRAGEAPTVQVMGESLLAARYHAWKKGAPTWP